MATAQQGEVTRLLRQWSEGSPEALEELTPLVYQELKRLARSYLRNESKEPLLQTTALVHEAYLRLIGLDMSWEGRCHFIAISAKTMRRVLVDGARAARATMAATSFPSCVRNSVISVSDAHSSTIIS